jgi:hypothetical protein
MYVQYFAKLSFPSANYCTCTCTGCYASLTCFRTVDSLYSARLLCNGRVSNLLLCRCGLQMQCGQELLRTAVKREAQSPKVELDGGRRTAAAAVSLGR